MVNSLNFRLEEYRTLRAELLCHISGRDQTLLAMFITLGAFSGFIATSGTKFSSLDIAIAYISLLFLFSLIYNFKTKQISKLAAYIDVLEKHTEGLSWTSINFEMPKGYLDLFSLTKAKAMVALFLFLGIAGTVPPLVINGYSLNGRGPYLLAIWLLYLVNIISILRTKHFRKALFDSYLLAWDDSNRTTKSLKS